jgi:hypothetical protein
MSGDPQNPGSPENSSTSTVGVSGWRWTQGPSDPRLRALRETKAEAEERRHRRGIAIALATLVLTPVFSATETKV